MKVIRVLVADHHVLIRDGIRALLEKCPEMQIVAEASDGAEALRLIRHHQPDVALIKSTIPKLSVYEVTARVSKECTSVHVIVLSTHSDKRCMRRAIGLGAAAYLTMTASATELVLAIKAVANGKVHIDSTSPRPLADSARRGTASETLPGLTPRQFEVLRLIAEGNSAKQIALVLKVNVKTVETHRALLKDRLNIHDTAGLVRYAIKAGLIRLEP